MHARPRQTDEHHGNSATIRYNEHIARQKLLNYAEVGYNQ